ncbi:response regulator transcription factor [Reichenbachiella ulvae]|uniref:Response regulator n=1 Tax=Reichenbachiella ulvae TaxID=2980104 RepID=A0ABT3CUN4_9BACT|nr:response regulator [Reichenbachiella ulvae]MCV9387410.1 response regulator [Reichenbachiella ulvae]
MRKHEVDVLIIDDDNISRFLIANTIRSSHEDICLMEAHSPQMALNYLTRREENWPKIILCDINMPVMTGWDMLHKLSYQCCKHPETKIFMVSSSECKDDINQLKSNPRILALLKKPLSFGDVDYIFDFL